MIFLCPENDFLAIFENLPYGTDMIEYEIVRHDRIRGLRVLLNTIRMRAMHMHHDIELLNVLQSEGTVIVRNSRYAVQAGDCILVNAFDHHEILSPHPDFILLIIQFSRHLTDTYFSLHNIRFRDEVLKQCMPENAYQDMTKTVMKLAERYFTADRYNETGCVACLSEILYILLRHTATEAVSEEENARRKKNEQRMRRISEYIEANYRDQIRLRDIAEAENITETHLSHIIREYFGVSFQDYLRDKRLEHAVRLIGNENLTLGDIAARSGFSELKYMTAAFRDAFGMSPSAYRKQAPPADGESDIRTPYEHIYSEKEALQIVRAVTQNR